MSYTQAPSFPAGGRLHIALPADTIRRRLFTMDTLISGFIHDKDNTVRTGTLTKKDVFRWSIDLNCLRKLNVRSDYFEFGPTPGTKFYLVSNIGDPVSSYFTVALCRFPAPNSIHKDIRVSFSLLDTRDRCHHPSEKVMTEGVESVETCFDLGVCFPRNTTFMYNNHLRIQCSLDVCEIMNELCKMETTPDIPICNDSAQDLTSDLRSLLESGQHCDVILNLTGKEFKAHRSILATRSSVFAAMFEHDTLEKQQNRIDIVDISSDTMSHLLRYLYTGETEELSTQEFLSLFVAADKYNLPKLKILCSSSISPKITSDTALSVLTLAYLHQDDQLKQAAIDAILDNALKVIKSEEWLVFLREYSELANSVILKLASKSHV